MSPPGRGFIGLLKLQTAFPRPIGDVGNPNTFEFAVRTHVVRGATALRVVRGGASGRGVGGPRGIRDRREAQRDEARLLAPFVAAGRALVDAGAVAIGTSCGFLAPFQRELAAALPVPVAASALLQLAWLAPLLPAGRRAGVITIDAHALGARHLEAAGAPADTPVAGLAPDGELAQAIFGDHPRLDRAAACAEVLAAARRLRQTAPDLGAIVLECTNLPPYRDALMRATGLPVYDVNTLLRWLWAGAARPHPAAPARSDPDFEDSVP